MIVVNAQADNADHVAMRRRKPLIRHRSRMPIRASERLSPLSVAAHVPAPSQVAERVRAVGRAVDGDEDAVERRTVPGRKDAVLRLLTAGQHQHRPGEGGKSGRERLDMATSVCRSLPLFDYAVTGQS